MQRLFACKGYSGQIYTFYNEERGNRGGSYCVLTLFAEPALLARMGRPLRIQTVNGRYHVTARGNERKVIYRDDRDRLHFLDLLGEMVEGYGVQVHAYVLMDNHFH